jgi:hypothetical protein
MIESIPPKNPEVEQSQVTKEWPRRKRIDNEGAVKKSAELTSAITKGNNSS